MINRSAEAETADPTYSTVERAGTRLSWFEWWLTRSDWSKLDRCLTRFPLAEQQALVSSVRQLVRCEANRQGRFSLLLRGGLTVTRLLHDALPRALAQMTAPQGLAVLEAARRVSRLGEDPELFVKFSAAAAADPAEASTLGAALDVVVLFIETHPGSWEPHLDRLTRVVSPGAGVLACHAAIHLQRHGLDPGSLLSTGWPAAARRLSPARLLQAYELARVLGTRKLDPDAAVEALAGLHRLPDDEWGKVLTVGMQMGERHADPAGVLQRLCRLSDSTPPGLLPPVVRLTELLAARHWKTKRDQHLEKCLDEFAYRVGLPNHGLENLLEIVAQTIREVEEQPAGHLSPAFLAVTCRGGGDAECLRRLRKALAGADYDDDVIGAARRLPPDLLELALEFRAALNRHGLSPVVFLREADEPTLRPTRGGASGPFPGELPEELARQLSRIQYGLSGLAPALRQALELAPYYECFALLRRDAVRRFAPNAPGGEETVLPTCVFARPCGRAHTRYAPELTGPAALMAWAGSTQDPAEREQALRRLLDLQTRVPAVLELLDTCGVLGDPHSVRSVYLTGSFVWKPQPNNLNLFVVLGGDAPHTRILPPELAARGFPHDRLPAPLSLECVGERAFASDLPAAGCADPLHLFRARLVRMARLAGAAVGPDGPPPYGGLIHLRTALRADLERADWPDLGDDLMRIQSRRKWRARELEMLCAELGLPPDGEDFALLLKNATNLLAIEVLASALQVGFGGVRRDASPAALEQFRQYYGASFEFAHALIRSLTAPAPLRDPLGTARRAAALRILASRPDAA